MCLLAGYLSPEDKSGYDAMQCPVLHWEYSDMSQNQFPLPHKALKWSDVSSHRWIAASLWLFEELSRSSASLCGHCHQLMFEWPWTTHEPYKYLCSTKRLLTKNLLNLYQGFCFSLSEIHMKPLHYLAHWFTPYASTASWCCISLLQEVQVSWSQSGKLLITYRRRVKTSISKDYTYYATTKKKCLKNKYIYKIHNMINKLAFLLFFFNKKDT